MLLKDLYSPEFYTILDKALGATLPGFDSAGFSRQIFTPEFDSLELKQRMSHTADVLHQFIGDDFATAAETICRLIDNLRHAGVYEQSIEFMFLPDYIERYGIDDFETALAAIEIVTQYTSCEYAVRPFILRYGEPMLRQMLDWSRHRNNMVRRLASEGARPRLPWAMALPGLKRDPSPILQILENLKNDSCEIVRRSVANNLNDISKDNPETTLRLAREWLGENPATDALVKHGCRTLLKQSHPAAMILFDFDSESFELSGFSLQTPTVVMGDCLEFSVAISNRARKPRPLRLEYAIYLLKQNGSHNRKVFKLSEREISAGKSLTIDRKHRFKPITTRRYHAGRHSLAVIVNGVESEPIDFELRI